MRFLRKLAPHAAILIGNMYYVFWGIDRVNKTMNFIDNEYTKPLLLLLAAFAAVNIGLLLPLTLRQTRRSVNPGPVYVRLGLLALNALLAAVIFVLLAVDLFWADSMIFLNEFVKVLILILCIVSLLNALQVTARQRAAIRMAGRRPAQQRRPMPSQARSAQPYARPAQSARQPQPYARSAQPSGYGRTAANVRPSTRIPEQTRRRY